MNTLISSVFYLPFIALIMVCKDNVEKENVENNYQEGFEIQMIDEDLRNKMISKNVFNDHSPIPIERLRLLKIKHFDFDNKERNGEIVVLDACSDQVLKVFKNLFNNKFPLNKVALITEYNGSDSLSMADNNTSAHNLRKITGGGSISLHAYGTAIDINPVNNPYLAISCRDDSGIAKFEPLAGIKFANRRENRLGKTNRQGMAEEVIAVFAKNGFYRWGGYWDCTIDYQHFEISRSISELLASMKPDEATRFFKITENYFNKYRKPIEDTLASKIGKGVSLKDFYSNNPDVFFEMVQRLK